MKKKILIVSPYFPPHIGGAENYVYNIARGLASKNTWEVVVVTTKNGIKRIKTGKYKNIKMYYLPVLFNLSNTPINPVWYFHLKKIFNREKPSIINAHAPVPFLSDLACMANRQTPFILTYHDGTMVKQKSLFNIPIFIYEQFFLKIILGKADAIICCSDFVRKDFLKKYLGKSMTVNPGVQTAGRKVIKKNGKNILFVASLTKSQTHKGLSKLLVSFSEVKEKIKNARLTVVGAGDALTQYKDEAKKLGIQKDVIFKGGVYGQKLIRIFRKSDVLVHPTSKESFGMVIIEAMSQGTPVIATRVGGISGIINHGEDGFLIKDTEDKNNLSKLIVKLLTNKKLTKKMGEKGIAKVRSKYLWRLQIEKTDNIFSKYIT